MKVSVVATDAELLSCRAIRKAVFVDEQNVPEAEEWDGKDGEAIHLLATVAGEVAGTARLRVLDTTGKIERVCVLPAFRGQGLGEQLMAEAAQYYRQHTNVVRLKLGAQLHAIPFYERLGYTAQGPVYDDAGIPHRDMTQDLTRG